METLPAPPPISAGFQQGTQVDGGETESHPTPAEAGGDSPILKPRPRSRGGKLKPEPHPLCMCMGRVAVINLLKPPRNYFHLTPKKNSLGGVVTCLYLSIAPPPHKTCVKTNVTFLSGAYTLPFGNRPQGPPLDRMASLYGKCFA